MYNSQQIFECCRVCRRTGCCSFWCSHRAELCKPFHSMKTSFGYLSVLAFRDHDPRLLIVYSMLDRATPVSTISCVIRSLGCYGTGLFDVNQAHAETGKDRHRSSSRSQILVRGKHGLADLVGSLFSYKGLRDRAIICVYELRLVLFRSAVSRLERTS